MAERRVRAESCCAAGETETGFGERVALGGRRRLLVRRVLLSASLAFAVAAVVVTITGGSPGLADRLAWATCVWGAGLALGLVRRVVTGRSLDWRLVVIVAGVVVGAAWQPLAAAVVAVALLAEQVLRRRGARAPAAGQVPSQFVGQAG
ncbi:hypothetical protein AA958_19160 [Streptomyces sp. CNQ-509]|uniref:hypothetical protein n=1 Tax=Streptomyces sp. CNQ-509 TaxID=444103 RepID=UPI00062E0BC0|nr:hypothetical protein [Streptomyces sp. CNQ-509]AKH83956.1 hypothetical protein AA958_19160 [Streptomyces sp. CNQ-509]